MKKNILFSALKSFNKFRTSAGKLFLLLWIFIISADNSTVFHRYLWANYNHFAGNISQAQDWYNKLFSANPSIYTYKGHLYTLAESNQLNNFKTILELMPVLEKKFSNDPDVQLIFVKALEKTNQIKKADHLVMQLSHSFKTHAEITFRATQAYIRRQESENALLTIDAFLNNSPRRPNNFVFYFLKTQIHMQLNQLSAALEDINKCLEMHPYFDKGWLLCASLYEKEGKIKEALSGYATFLELSGGNKEIEKHLFTLMLKYKAIEDNKQILLSHTITIENALLLFQQQRYPQALAHINSCIELHPASDECKLLKIQILVAMKDFNQIAQVISLWISAHPENDLWPKSLCLLMYNGMPRTHIIQTLHNIVTQSPDNMWCNLYCADICMRDGNSQQAITCLENALPYYMHDTLRIKTLYQLSLLHYDQKNYSTMLTHLENAYTLQQQNPHVNNALAYYWATKGKDIHKARSFLDQALACDDKNPYFLDTKAVILYKEKKYEDAQKILEQLTSYNNGTMLLHLAKVYYALNNKENADIFTQKAQALTKNSYEKKAIEKMQHRLTPT
ncbi:MAG TPA: hypothetical protein VKU36_03080 [Candidatus Babeliales bacterium]|nr:hypothetical protein [Candidatus Babeliales bacterium]